MDTVAIEHLSLKLAALVAQERELKTKLDALGLQKAAMLRAIAEASFNGKARTAEPVSQKGRILEILRADPRREFGTAEIGEMVGIAANAASVYLGELVRASAIVRVEKGRYKAA